MSCGVGHRHGSDLALLCLWHRLVATTLIRPLAWETPSAEGAALKGQKQTNKQKDKAGIPMWTSKSNIWCCHCSGCFHGTDSIPGPGNIPVPCHGCGQNQTKQKHLSAFFLYVHNITEGFFSGFVFFSTS